MNMHHKFSASIHRSEQSLQEMLERFFAQNPEPKVLLYEEHGAKNKQRLARLSSEGSTEDSRERYWAERKAQPNLDDIGSELEWHLLASLMELNPGWRHDGWWCDGVSFLDVALHHPAPNTLRGLALTYWLTSDETENKSADLAGCVLADIELKLIGAEAKQALAYSISFWVDGHWHWFSEKDFAILPTTSPQMPQPNLSVMRRIQQVIEDDDRFYFALSQIVGQFDPAIDEPELQPETKTAVQVKQKSEADPDCWHLPLPALLWWLDSDDQKKARRAARSIGNLGASARTAAPKLFSIVYDKDANTYFREESLEALIQIGLTENEVLSLLELLLKTSDYGLYSQVGKVLAQAGGQAIPVVLQALKGSTQENPLDYIISYSIFAYLKQQGVAALPAFLELLETEAWEYDALNALHYCGVKAIPKLIEVCGHKIVRMRAEAVRAMGKIGEPSDVVIDSLGHALTDPDLLVRVRAIEALGKLGVAALPVLLEVIETNDKILLYWVIQALGRLGGAAQPARNHLLRLQAGNDSTLCYLATTALSRL